MYLKSSSRELVDPHLTISDQPLQVIANNTFKFIGLTIKVPKDIVSTKSELKSLLQSMLTTVDEAPLTGREKLKLYSLGICPRLNCLLTINEFPMTWLERHLEALATRCLKKCSGVTKPTNPNILHIPRAKVGPNLPAISTLYKKLKSPSNANSSPPMIPQWDTWLKRIWNLRWLLFSGRNLSLR